ncbi:MAG TPA: outer membrane protein assembly factor BamD [Acidobacteriaceae bacterium]
MMQSSTRSFASLPSRFSDVRAALASGFTVAALLASTLGAQAQVPTPADAAQAESAVQATQAGQPKNDVTISNEKPAKHSKKEDKVVASKDTKKEVKKAQKVNQLEGVDAKLPDKTLYDKAEDAVKHGRYDVARLDLQTLLNTYPDSQFQMRAKLAIADSWYKEGGTAALTQAEQEYKDFITFFPNAPEAAEAQMRVGDIYFRQMDKPDRDYTKTIHAEEEYRLMLQQFPDSPLVPQANQRLREVQETLASRESDIASFYSTHANWPATIARYQTVVDTYPLYSHMDDVLIGLGDAYEAEARYVRALRLPEAGKARLERIYDDQAAAAYRKVILEHSAAPHVEDARDRLVGMNLPVPTPTPEQVAASAALENSRGQYTLSKRATVFLLHKADTVSAATTGNPPLEDPAPTTAPTIVRKSIDDFNQSVNGAPRSANAPATANSPAPASTPPASAAPAATTGLSLQDVPAANTPAAGASAVITSAPATSPASSSTGNSVGIEIVQPSSGSSGPATPGSTTFPGTATPADAAPATTAPAANPSQTGGIGPVGPDNATPLAPIQKAEKAPDAVNEVTPGSQPAAQAPPANGKKPKPTFDKSDESSSKHKKKKGLGKLNPF